MASKLAKTAVAPLLPERPVMAARPKIKRGEIWACDLEPQGHKAEPAKHNRPVLVLQIDVVNNNPHIHSVIVVPGTTDVETVQPAENYPMRVQVQPQEDLKEVTDLLCSSVRAVGVHRLKHKLATVSPNTLKRVAAAISQLIGNEPLKAY